MTLNDFGRQVGISKSFLCKIEQGKQTPSLAVAVRISEATKGAVKPNDFLAPPEGDNHETEAA